MNDLGHSHSNSLDVFQCAHQTCKEYFQPNIVVDDASLYDSPYPHLVFQCPYCKTFYSAPFTYSQEKDAVGIILLTAPQMNDNDSRFVAS